MGDVTTHTCICGIRADLVQPRQHCRQSVAIYRQPHSNARHARSVCDGLLELAIAPAATEALQTAPHIIYVAPIRSFPNHYGALQRLVGPLFPDSSHAW